MTSVLWEVQVSAAALMLDDASLAGKLDGRKVYDTEIPPRDPRPHRYVVISDIPGDVPSRSFNRGGKDSLLWFHIWDDGTRPAGEIRLGNENPLEIVADLERLFDGKRIALDTWKVRLGEINLIRLSRDPNIAYMHGVMQYRILSKAPVAP